MKFVTALFMYSCGSFQRWSTGRLSTHQSSHKASVGVYGTFPAWWPRSDGLNKLGSLRLVLYDARTLRNGGCLG